LFAIKQLFSIKAEVYEKLKSGSDSDSEDAQEQEERVHFEKFLVIRNQYFMQRMSDHINLKLIIQFLQENGHNMKYQEFRSTFEDKVQSEGHFEQILELAQKLIRKDVGADTVVKIDFLTEGLVQLQDKCSACKQKFNTWFDNKEEIWVFKCEHVFHARCIAKNEGACSICFNELDAFCKCLSVNSLRVYFGVGQSNQQIREAEVERTEAVANHGGRE
jgi:hypothetical protein